MRCTKPAGCAAVALPLLCGHAGAGEKAPDVVATQLRAQGYACVKPKSAVRDKKDSRPDAALWIVECRNATYRVRLIPHRAAEVELAPEPPPK